MDEIEENSIIEYWHRLIARDPERAATEAATIETTIRFLNKSRKEERLENDKILIEYQKKLEEFQQKFNFHIDKAINSLENI